MDFTCREEVDARVGITSKFLSEYPVDDVGFEFIVFPTKLDESDIATQASHYLGAKELIERDHGTRVHASMHFPTTPDTALFLGSDTPATTDRVLSLFERCVVLAKTAGIATIVVHSGGNVTEQEWVAMVMDSERKTRVLNIIVSTLVRMVEVMTRSGYRGTIAWENMPWPFDIPAFTFTNVIATDFSTVLDNLDARLGDTSSKIGICFDACHAFILAGTARYLQERPARERFVPPGILSREMPALLDAVDPGCLLDIIGNRVIHLHVADSGGAFDHRGGRVISQMTEGDELGTASFTASGVLDSLLSQIVASKVDSHQKLGCTLEIKHDDLKYPEKTAKSLAWLGRRYFNTRG